MFLPALYYRYWRLLISISFLILLLLSAIWVMLPAYLPNPVAALCGGGTPIDLGRSLPDGQRILGDGKTVRGLVAGVGAGIGIGLVQVWLSATYGLDPLPRHTVTSVILLATGALLGDLCKSFFKRRFRKERGSRWAVADQYDLVAGSLLLTLALDPSWILGVMTLPLLIVILVLTPLLHRAVNIVGFRMGVKEVPW